MEHVRCAAICGSPAGLRSCSIRPPPVARTTAQRTVANRRAALAADDSLRLATLGASFPIHSSRAHRPATCGVRQPPCAAGGNGTAPTARLRRPATVGRRRCAAGRSVAGRRTAERPARSTARPVGRSAERDRVPPGQTGGELLAAWRADPQRAALIDAANPWPTTHVTAEELSPTLPAQLSPVRHLGTRSELLSGWTFYTDPAGSKLVAFDRLGRQAWQVPTASTGLFQGRRGPTYVRYVTTSGRYLLLVVEDQWTLLDGLGSEASPTVLANRRLISSGDGTTGNPNFPRLNQPGRLRNRTWIDQQGGLRRWATSDPSSTECLSFSRRRG